MTSTQIKAQIEGLKDTLDREPARKLVKYVKRTGAHKGELVDFTPSQYRNITGKAPKAVIVSKRTRRVPWEYALDDIATELGYRSDEELQKAIEKSVRIQRQIDELRHDLSIQKEKEDRPIACKSIKRKRRISCNGVVIEAVTGQKLKYRVVYNVHVHKPGQKNTKDNKAGEVRGAKGLQKEMQNIAKQFERRYGKRRRRSKK